jgi:hypothetical protein
MRFGKLRNRCQDWYQITFAKKHLFISQKVFFLCVTRLGCAELSCRGKHVGWCRCLCGMYKGVVVCVQKKPVVDSSFHLDDKQRFVSAC